MRQRPDLQGGRQRALRCAIRRADLLAFAGALPGRCHAYLNCCTHVAMEMDYQPTCFSMIPKWLAQTHGAAHAPDKGRALAARAVAGLRPIPLSESDSVVRWYCCLQPTTCGVPEAQALPHGVVMCTLRRILIFVRCAVQRFFPGTGQAAGGFA